MNRPATASQSLGGTNADSVLRKLFFGERISQNTRLLFFEFGSRKWRRRGLGRNPPLAPLISFGEIRAGLFFLPKFKFIKKQPRPIFAKRNQRSKRRIP